MYSNEFRQTVLIRLLRWSTFLLFAGRAWQHLFWDAPFRTLLWDPEWMQGLVTHFTNYTWQAYVTSQAAGRFINILIIGFGVFYGLMAVLTLFANRRMKGPGWLYGLSTIALAWLSFLYCKEKFYHAGQFFEYAIQFSLPVLFYLALCGKIGISKLVLSLKIAIALTFSAHGLYALGYYPQPGVFVDMVINTLHVSESAAKNLLYVAGILDMIVAVGIFIPRVEKYALFYTVLWGAATAVARTWANFYIDFPLNSIHQNLYETVYRLPHALVPLTVLWIQYPEIFSFGRKKQLANS